MDPRRAVTILLLASGVLLRGWLALVTDNADSRTLTWGASFVAVDPLRDPWLATAAHSLGDPIPLDSTRALSLATGPIPVLSGAVTLAAADLVGLIDLADYEELNGRTMPGAHSAVHRFSYFLPEALLLVTLRVLARKGGGWHTMLACWATTPLAVFTFGQGMPDTWTVLMVLAGWSALERAYTALDPAASRRLYALAIAFATIGALWTKLFPVFLLPVIVLLVARDPVVTNRVRTQLAAFAAGCVAVGFLPYLVSRPAYVSMFVRFEYDMLERGTSVTLLSAIPEAGLAMIAIAAALTWAFGRRADDALPAAETLLVSLVLSVTLLSGIITHLLYWVLPAVFLVARRNRTRGLFLHAAVGALTLVHVVWYDWLGGLVVDRVAPEVARGAAWDTVVRRVPMANLLASLVAALVLVAAASAVNALARRTAPPAVRSIDRRTVRNVAMGGLVVPFVIIATLVGAAAAGAESGRVAANLESEYWDANRPKSSTDAEPVAGVLLFERDGSAWVSPPVKGRGAADRVRIALDKRTQFSTDLLRVEIVEPTGIVLAAGEMPVWEAEPNSERWPTEIRLDARVAEVQGTVVRVSRKSAGAGPAEAELRLPALTVQRRGPDGTLLAPTWGVDLELRDAQGRRALGTVSSAVTQPGRLGVAAAFALAVAAAAWALLPLLLKFEHSMSTRRE